MTIGRIVFGSPGFLWLGVLILLVIGLDVWRRWGTPGRRIGGMIVRSLVIATLAIALADPRWQKKRELAWVVFVVDRSGSVPDDGLAQAMARVESIRGNVAKEVRVGLVFADARPTVAVMPGEQWVVPDPVRGTDTEATDLGAALDVARALIPEGDSGEIVLLSDGRPTTGERSSEAIANRMRGVPVSIVTLAPERREAAVTSVALDEPLIRPGATTAGNVEIDGGAEPFKGQVVVRVDGEVVHAQDVELGAQQSKKIPFEYSPPLGTPEGSLGIDVELIPDSGGTAATADATVIVGQKPRVLLLAGEKRDGELLSSALKAEAMEVDVRNLEANNFPKEVPKDTDLVILANAPASVLAGRRGMSDEFLESLAKYVDAGGGLVVLGGPQSYDMGGYAATAISRVLPVRLDPIDPLVEPAATIVVVMDQSGSMGEPVSSGGTTKQKIELADEGVVASLQMLRPFDYVAVAAVTTEVHWEVNLMPVRDAIDIEKRILSIRSSGGGIFVYTGMEGAQKVLKSSTTPLRHLLLFSDTADSEEQASRDGGKTCLQLAEEMRKEGITTSVIGIGEESDKDTQFLKDLADAGGGKFYLTNDATKLRALFVQETERLVDTSVQQGEFRPEVIREHRMISGIDYKSGPSLGGYQKLDARKTAEVLMRGPKDDPILVTWRYGLGQVVTWSSDAGTRWAKEWISWPGYARQWTQISRFALRTRAGDSTALEVDFSGKQPIARLARRDPAGMTLEAPVKLRLKTDETPRELSLTATEPGLYEAKLDVAPNGVHVLEVVDEAGNVIETHKFVVPPSEERRFRTADGVWLEEIAARTKGSVEPTTALPQVLPSSTPEHLRLWPFVALAAALLFPIDAALRRMSRVV